MSGDLEASTSSRIPTTPMEWAIWGLTAAGGVVFGVIARAFGMSKRIALAETAADMAKKDASEARSATSAGKDACTAALASVQASLRGELQSVGARADAAHAAATAAMQTAQAAAAGASNPAALRVAIADGIEGNHQIRTTSSEVERLRIAADKGAENNGKLDAKLERILGKLEGM